MENVCLTKNRLCGPGERVLWDLNYIGCAYVRSAGGRLFVSRLGIKWFPVGSLREAHKMMIDGRAD